MAIITLTDLEELPQPLVVQMEEVIAWAATVTARSAATSQKCVNGLSIIQEMRREITAHFTTQRKPYTDAAKENRAAEKAALALIAPAESRLKKQILGWDAKCRVKEDAAATAALATGTAVSRPSARPTGVSLPTTSRASLVDVQAFLSAVVQGIVPLDVVSSDAVKKAIEVQLTKLVKSQGEFYVPIPGVLVVSTPNVVAPSPRR